VKNSFSAHPRPQLKALRIRRGNAAFGPRLTHNVYVVKLHPSVLRDARFRQRNPGYKEGMPCVYVGMTGLTPERQFENQLQDVNAEGFVKRFGLRLMPELYDYANPMPFDAARGMLTELAHSLRLEGYGVWQD
jgi:hypothetical protein